MFWLFQILGVGTELLTIASIVSTLHVIPDMRGMLQAMTSIQEFASMSQEYLDVTERNKSKLKIELEATVKELVDAVHGLNRVR